MYIGSFKQNKKHGHGELYLNSIPKYVGFFENGSNVDHEVEIDEELDEQTLQNIFNQNDKQFDEIMSSY